MSRRRTVTALACGTAAAATELVACAAPFGAVAAMTPLTALGLHVLAAAACVAAARQWPGDAARAVVDQDLVLWTALFVPLFGPALAWLFPMRKSRLDVLDAHAWFEEYGESMSVTRLVATCPRDEDEDDFVPHDVMSFSEVLRHGSLDHRRNALRKLAEMRTPRHLGMLRETLYSDNAELRLCAYTEIQRLAREQEDRIAELRGELSELSEEGTVDQRRRYRLLTAIAEAHQSYASSGLLDPEMARYHLGQARRAVEEVWLWCPDDWRACVVQARTLSDLGHHDQAQRAFAGLKPADRARVEVCVTQAEIAFRRRDFAAAREAGRCIDEQRLPVPEWLRALGSSMRHAGTESVS